MIYSVQKIFSLPQASIIGYTCHRLSFSFLLHQQNLFPLKQEITNKNKEVLSQTKTKVAQATQAKLMSFHSMMQLPRGDI